MDVSERVADVLDFKNIGTTRIRLDYLRPASLAGSDDRKLLATLRTDGSGAVVDGPGSVPVAVASADLPDTVKASGPGAPIAAIASAVSAAASPITQGTTVAYSEPAPRPSLFTTASYATTASQAPALEPAVVQTSDDNGEPEATTTVVRNDALARVTIAYAPLPPERPYDLGITTLVKSSLVKSSPGVTSKPATADDDEDEVIAPRPPVRPKQLATLFFAPERLSDTQGFTKGNPFAGLKPQTFVRLQAP
jgi:rare lipoprotein A